MQEATHSNIWAQMSMQIVPTKIYQNALHNAAIQENRTKYKIELLAKSQLRKKYEMQIKGSVWWKTLGRSDWCSDYINLRTSEVSRIP